MATNASNWTKGSGWSKIWNVKFLIVQILQMLPILDSCPLFIICLFHSSSFYLSWHLLSNSQSVYHHYPYSHIWTSCQEFHFTVDSTDSFNKNAKISCIFCLRLFVFLMNILSRCSHFINRIFPGRLLCLGHNMPCIWSSKATAEVDPCSWWCWSSPTA